MEFVNHHFARAIRAAIEAGEAIMRVYDNPESDWQVERKADNSPLTLADRQAHAVISDRLAATPFPLLSEEGAHASYEERAAWAGLWVVDPLDGTKEFIKRNGEFTVNIALVQGGVPVAGVIFVPVSRTLYWGVCGAEGLSEEPLAEGAFKVERVPEGVYAVADMAEAVRPLPLAGSAVAGKPFSVVASRSHLSPETEVFIGTLRREHGEVVLRSAGSSLKICLIAEGEAQLYPRFAPTMEWDTAAGHAILRAAGGEMRHAETGEPLAYNKPDLHNPWFIARLEA